MPTVQLPIAALAVLLPRSTIAFSLEAAVWKSGISSVFDAMDCSAVVIGHGAYHESIPDVGGCTSFTEKKPRVEEGAEGLAPDREVDLALVRVRAARVRLVPRCHRVRRRRVGLRPR
jgi:hypothetical protein